MSRKRRDPAEIRDSVLALRLAWFASNLPLRVLGEASGIAPSRIWKAAHGRGRLRRAEARALGAVVFTGPEK